MKRTYQFSQFSWVLFLISTCLLMLMNSTPVQAAPELTVSNYELVSSMRITRTVFEYTYKADITNTGSDALDVSATLSVSAPGVTVLDSELSFGDVVAGATVKSSDTFVIRQDRQYSFAVDALQWEIKSDANPTVQWTPSSLYASLAAGKSTTTIASFVPTANATNVSVGVLPELEPYVSVSPNSFASVAKGVTYPVTVTMTAPVEMVVGAYDGTIQLRQGTRTLTEPLAVDLTFSPIPLPPDPGEAGKLTIEGIDSDGDGVRDDVQRWIAFKSPDSQMIRAALTQDALALQEALLIAHNKERAIELAREDKSPTCLVYVAGDEAPRLMAKLEAEIANTEARSRAYIAYNANLGGQVFEGLAMDEWKAACSFDADAMGD